MQANFLRSRIYFTVIVTLAIWGLLIWNYFHGGVPSHHILAREDLPSFSNWWGALLLPLLTWFLLYRIQRRLIKTEGKSPETLPIKVWMAFVVSLLFGIMLAVFFSFGISDLPGHMLLSILAIALFFPVYRSECLLGFVIGMTYTFGAVLPMLIGSILILSGTFIHLIIRPAILYVVSLFSRK